MSKMTMAQVKSGRWIGASHILPQQEEPPSPVLLDIDEMTTMNEMDDLLFAHEIYVYNTLDKNIVTMTDRMKLTISPTLYSQNIVTPENLEKVLTEIFGPEEFVITANKIRNVYERKTNSN